MRTHRFARRFLAASLGVACFSAAFTAEIQRPADAPFPLSPEESAKRIVLPTGFRLELVASEPLVREPSGVCWDERGQLFVCELHGYNLEGQFDIDELNKTGQLDREVRRVQAIPQASGSGVMLELAADGRWPDAKDPRRRYYAGTNSTQWQARQLAPNSPSAWRVVTLDLWKDNGTFTLTGLAPTALGGAAFFDRIELWRDLSALARGADDRKPADAATPK